MSKTKKDETEYFEIMTLKLIDRFLCDKEFPQNVQKIQVNNKNNIMIYAAYKIASEQKIQCSEEMDVISSVGCTMPDIFTRYDAMVLNAVSTLYGRGYESFTPHMIYRLMRGRNDYNTIPTEKLEEVRDSVQKLRQMLVSMDLRKQMPGIKHPDKLQGMYRDSNVLQLECFFRSESRNVKCAVDIYWRFLPTLADGSTNEPILRQYARVTKQLIRMPVHLISTGSNINKSDDIIALRIYLYKNIKWMKCNYRNSKYLKYETIMRELQIDISNVARQDKAYKRFCKLVKEILDIFIG